MNHAELRDRVFLVRSLIVLSGLSLLAAPVNTASAADKPDRPVTFAKDVAAIFQAKCQDCHRPGTVAPMSLLTYQDARPWAKSIRERVITRQMPPWHIDRTVGVQHFMNDRSLSDKELDTIVRWVDAGAPMGDPKDLPPARKWPVEEAWELAKQLGEPDLVIKSGNFSIPAVGDDQWWDPVSPIPLTEPRWVRAVEIRPATVAGRKVTHHAIARLWQNDDEESETRTPAPRALSDGSGLLMEWAIGKQYDIFRDNTGKLLVPGAEIQWDIHLHASGEAVQDHVELAIYLYPKNAPPKLRTRLMMFRGTQGRFGGIDIPPNSVADVEATTMLRLPARLESFQPHMHLRGRAMSMEAILPDGTVRMLSNVDHFDFNWMNNYIYSDEDAPVLPAGTQIRIHAWHDNTTANRNNPDPSVHVGYGRRTTDEMAHAWVNVTYLSDEEYQDWVKKHEPPRTEIAQASVRP
jgi:mono/diheme cytochrome c family protein